MTSYSPADYSDLDVHFRIFFQCPDLDLREMAVASTIVHSIVNVAAESVLRGLGANVPSPIPRTSAASSILGSAFDGLSISLQITALGRGSFFADVRLRIKKNFDAFVVGVSSAVAATVISSVLQAPVPPNCTVEHTPPTVAAQAQPRKVDVGPQLQCIAGELAKTNKPFELTFEDKKTGQKVTIRSAMPPAKKGG